MITSPANAIEDEIHRLMHFQIETFRQPVPLDSFQLHEHHRRAEEIRTRDVAGCGTIEKSSLAQGFWVSGKIIPPFDDNRVTRELHSEPFYVPVQFIPKLNDQRGDFHLVLFG
jgi:hypothetical protein